MSRPALILSLALLVPLAAAAAAAPRPFASIEEFARAVGMKPGGWHTQVKVTAIEVELPPGVDPSAMEAVKAAMTLKVGSVQEQHECAGPTPQGPSLPGILLSRDCSFSGMEAGDGHWAIKSSCNMGQGGTAATVARGTYAPERVTGMQEADFALDGLVVHVKGESVSRFTGHCRPPPPPVIVDVKKPEGD